MSIINEGSLPSEVMRKVASQNNKRRRSGIECCNSSTFLICKVYFYDSLRYVRSCEHSKISKSLYVSSSPFFCFEFQCCCPDKKSSPLKYDSFTSPTKRMWEMIKKLLFSLSVLYPGTPWWFLIFTSLARCVLINNVGERLFTSHEVSWALLLAARFWLAFYNSFETSLISLLCMVYVMLLQDVTCWLELISKTPGHLEELLDGDDCGRVIKVSYCTI